MLMNNPDGCGKLPPNSSGLAHVMEQVEEDEHNPIPPAQRSTNKEALLDHLRNSIVGCDEAIVTPFGLR
jgi:hypothetical protein